MARLRNPKSEFVTVRLRKSTLDKFKGFGVMGSTWDDCFNKAYSILEKLTNKLEKS